MQKPTRLPLVTRAAGMLAACLCGLPCPVLAHHSPSAFDMTREHVIEGVISNVLWRNPHVYITVETEDADGKKTNQEIEAAAASSLLVYGVKQQDLKVGERVSVRVNPNRRGPGHGALGLALTRPDGEVVAFRAGPAATAPPRAVADSLAGIWTPDSGTFVALSMEAPQWPLTAAGKAAQADLATRGRAAADCVPFGIPVIMMTPDITTITLTDALITLRVDAAGLLREVHLATEFPPELQPSPQGYSIGRWEAETLVVETTAFTADAEGLGFAMPSSEQKHVIERFKLSANKDTLNYQAILQDPLYLTAPVTLQTNWAYRPDLQPSGQPCDLESAQRFQTTP